MALLFTVYYILNTVLHNKSFCQLNSFITHLSQINMHAF